jgi:hypothetical protein
MAEESGTISIVAERPCPYGANAYGLSYLLICTY